jgi:signal transduction histidine kinase
MVVRSPVEDRDLTVLSSVAPLRRGAETIGAIAVFQDISALKALERQRTEFFGVASHEIKTPITALQLQLQLAQRALRSGHMPRLAEMIDGATTRIAALVSLVNELLDVTRIDAGRLALEMRPLDLGALTVAVVRRFPADDAHPITVTVPEAPITVNADARRVTETLENLLSNALKYSPDGGAVEVSVSRDGNVARVRIRDRGFGVPLAEQPYIFDRFFRTSRARAYGGVGLGLFISRDIARRHGGSLELESSSEAGSTFVLSFPVATEAAVNA